MNGDDAPSACLSEQAGYFGDGGADQRSDLGLAALLEVIQLGHPAQQLMQLI